MDRVVDIACPLCGASLGELTDNQPGRVVRRCPGCGARLELRRGADERSVGDPGTVFQPRVLVESVAGPGSETLAAPADAATVEPEQSGTRRRHAGPEAYFLILGAAAGRERIPVVWARTVFGRAGADVEIADPAVADHHFQVEVMGREFYLRDLASGLGTRLNGREVRYTELLAGDEVAAGGTVLVFRTADDGIGRHAP
jgi:hypothetical protein